MALLVITSDSTVADVTIGPADASVFSLVGAELQANTQPTGNGVFNAFAGSRTISLQGGAGISRTLTIALDVPGGQGTVTLNISKNNGRDGSGTISVTAVGVAGGFVTSANGVSTGPNGTIATLHVV